MDAASTQWVAAPRSDSAGRMLIAIGDIHGHADELQALQSVIRGHVESLKPAAATLVYLGDYIDRGPQVLRVLDLIADAAEAGGQAASADRLPAVRTERLVGNHDQYLIEVLDGTEGIDFGFLSTWLDSGGERTLEQFGFEGYGRLIRSVDVAELGRRCRLALGEPRLAVLASLKPMVRIGDYVFVHGHSISVPAVHPHRIGVDAGCYAHGALCAVEIHQGRLRFVGVSKNPAHRWDEKLGGKGRWQWTSEPA